MSPSMKNASTNINPSWDGIKINKSILVEKEKDDYCSGCNTMQDKIHRIYISGLTFRLCDNCNQVLKEKL